MLYQRAAFAARAGLPYDRVLNRVGDDGMRCGARRDRRPVQMIERAARGGVAAPAVGDYRRCAGRRRSPASSSPSARRAILDDRVYAAAQAPPVSRPACLTTEAAARLRRHLVRRPPEWDGDHAGGAASIGDPCYPNGIRRRALVVCPCRTRRPARPPARPRPRPRGRALLGESSVRGAVTARSCSAAACRDWRSGARAVQLVLQGSPGSCARR